jgi:ferredoxin
MGLSEKLIDTIGTNQYLEIETSLCSRFRTPKSACSLCADVCPADAITLSGAGARISGACVDCGACFSACPNGVFALKQEDDRQIIRQMAAILQRSDQAAEKEIRICCERGVCEADVLVPCLARLTEPIFLEAATAGFSKITVLRPQCHDCRNVKASPHIGTIMKHVYALFEMAGIGRERIVVQEIPLQQLSKKPGEAVSRRDFFSALGRRAAEVAAAAVPVSDEKRNEDEPASTGQTIEKTRNAKRTLLLRSLAQVSPIKDISIPSEDSILAQIEVSSQCRACGVCVTLCPAGALTQEWDDKRYRLTFRPSLCTNCRVCFETCMPKAITAAKSTRLNDLLEDREITLFDAGKRACSLCGMDFVQPLEQRHPADSGAADLLVICPLCLDRHRKHMAFMQNGFWKQGA